MPYQFQRILSIEWHNKMTVFNRFVKAWREAVVSYFKEDLPFYFHCYTVHVVELLNYYTNHCTYIKFIKFTH